MQSVQLYANFLNVNFYINFKPFNGCLDIFSKYCSKLNIFFY